MHKDDAALFADGRNLFRCAVNHRVSRSVDFGLVG
jgi:hypothetical protein